MSVDFDLVREVTCDDDSASGLCGSQGVRQPLDFGLHTVWVIIVATLDAQCRSVAVCCNEVASSKFIGIVDGISGSFQVVEYKCLEQFRFVDLFPADRLGHCCVCCIDFAGIYGLPGRVVAENRYEMDQSGSFSTGHVFGNGTYCFDPKLVTKLVGCYGFARVSHQVQQDPLQGVVVADSSCNNSIAVDNLRIELT